MTPTRKWLTGIAGSLLLLFAAVYFFDWNLARPYIARKVAASTGRSFAINGDLKVRLSLNPHITVNDAALGNAPWSKDPLMAQVKRADFRIDLLKLLRGHLEFRELALSEPRLVLEINADGTPNWVFGLSGADREGPSLDSLAIDRGTLEYRDPASKTDLSFDVDTLEPSALEPETMVKLTGRGRFKGMETELQARGGALLSLRSAQKPYPIRASATLGTTKASIDGTLSDPVHFKGEELNFRLEGSDLALLYPIFGVPIPPTPAYRLAGFLSHAGELWTFKQFKGTVGTSDLAGNFSVDRARTPQKISADLVSRNLDLKDLAGFIGAAPGAKPTEHPQPAGKMLPVEPFNLEKLRAADADIRFKGAKIITRKLPLEKLEAHLIVKDGTLNLAPLNFGVAGGSLVAQIAMDGRKARIVTHADVTAKGLRLGQLFPDSKLNAGSTGAVGGRAKLDAAGNSVAQMLGSANGEAALIMDSGTVSELMLRLSDLDLANSLVALLGGDKQMPIRCMVANFKAVEGDFRVQSLVLDTTKVNVTGTGNVNFTDESLHLRLVAASKGFSLAALRGPILVTGPFQKPAVHPEMGNVIARGGIAVALGLLTGVGALLPLLEFGKDTDSHCAELMSEAKAAAGIK